MKKTLLACVVLAVLVMVGCGEKTDPLQLKAIKQEKMSQILPSGSSLLQKYEQDATFGGKALGKPTPGNMAYTQRVLLVDPSRREAALKYLCLTAKADGWQDIGQANPDGGRPAGIKYGCGGIKKAPKGFIYGLNVAVIKPNDEIIQENTTSQKSELMPGKSLIVVEVYISERPAKDSSGTWLSSRCAYPSQDCPIPRTEYLNKA